MMSRMRLVGVGFAAVLAAPLLVAAAGRGSGPPMGPSVVVPAPPGPPMTAAAEQAAVERWSGPPHDPPVVAPDPATPATAAADQAREASIPRQAGLPALTASQAAQGAAIATADSAIAGLIAGAEYRVARTGPWTSFGSEATGKTSELIGAAVEIVLAVPISIRGKQAPELIYDVAEATSTPYQTVRSTLDADGVQSLTVLVDLRTEKVVGVIPGPPGLVQGALHAPARLRAPRHPGTGD